VKTNNLEHIAEKINHKKKQGKLNNVEFNNLRFSNSANQAATGAPRMKTIKEVNEYDATNSPKRRPISPVKQSSSVTKTPIMDDYILNLPDDEEEVRDIPKPMSSNMEMKINDIKNAKNLKVNNTKTRYISDLLAEKLVDEILDYKKK
jgi:hypothetical protein